MKSWLRLNGLIAFVVVVTLIAGAGLFLAGPVARSILQSTLTAMNGAKVDIAEVSINYSPLGMSLQKIEVTDPTSPMVNSIEIGKASFSLVFGDLLFRKVTIDEMSISGLKINTPRRKSGAIEKVEKEKPKETKTDTAADDALFALPSVDDVIKNASFKTDSVVNQVDADISAAQQRFEKIKTELDDKARWQAYEQRYKEISAAFKGNALEKLKALKDAKKLGADLKVEQQNLSNAQKTIKQDINAINSGIKQVKNTISEDKKNIKEKYTGGARVGNTVGLLFGPKAGEYTQMASQWYLRIKPYIKSKDKAELEKKYRSKGQYIRFKEYQPKPDFYLKKASIDAQLPTGSYSGEITNFSTDQSMTKKPAVLRLDGSAQKDRDRETFYAEYNAVKPDKAFTQIKYDLSKYQMKDFEISGDQKMPVSIQQAVLSIKASGMIKDGNVDANLAADFIDTHFSSGPGGISLKGMINDALKNIHKFDVQIAAKGNVGSMKFDLASNIDNQIGGAIKQAIKKQTDEFEQALEKKLQAKYADKLAGLNKKLDAINSYQAQLDAKQAELKAKLSNLKL